MPNEVGLTAHPLDFNPPPIVKSTRAHARYTRLLEAQAAGQDIPEETLEKHRIEAYGRTNDA
jgi:hypothetical protein